MVLNEANIANDTNKTVRIICMNWYHSHAFVY